MITHIQGTGVHGTLHRKDGHKPSSVFHMPVGIAYQRPHILLDDDTLSDSSGNRILAFFHKSPHIEHLLASRAGSSIVSYRTYKASPADMDTLDIALHLRGNYEKFVSDRNSLAFHSRIDKEVGQSHRVMEVEEWFSHNDS